MIGMPADGTAISCRIVMAIGNGVMQSNNPILDNGGLLQPMEDWTRGVLKSIKAQQEK